MTRATLGARATVAMLRILAKRSLSDAHKYAHVLPCTTCDGASDLRRLNQTSCSRSGTRASIYDVTEAAGLLVRAHRPVKRDSGLTHENYRAP